MNHPEIVEPSVRATYVAQELADITDADDRTLRIHAEYMRYEKNPAQAVVFSVALNLAVLALLDKTVNLAGERASYDPKKAARVMKRSFRRRRKDRGQ